MYTYLYKKEKIIKYHIQSLKTDTWYCTLLSSARLFVVKLMCVAFGYYASTLSPRRESTDSLIIMVCILTSYTRC